ncbi:MAG: ATP-binding protein [Phycisphaerales bacterium]|nr:ATP-binding protein [Phycisphaerales bacterium]
MGTNALLQDPAFRKAVASIQRRAEKQTDWNKLIDLFVETDLFDRCSSTNTQLVLGRRGTGKTHLLRAFQKECTINGRACFFIDCTSLGSGLAIANEQPETIATKFFTAFLNQLGTELLDEALRKELPERTVQDKAFSHIVDGLATHIDPSPEGRPPTFNYRQIADSLARILELLQIDTLTIILDEWSLIPLGAQPFFAEYLKRGVLATRAIIIKISAVNYQCELGLASPSGQIGLQRGADIPDVIELDQYLIFDVRRDFVDEFFAQVLYNHLGSQLGWDLAISKQQKNGRVLSLFTQRDAFIELVRAAEGNTRDFLCIFGSAFFDFFRTASSSQSISIPNIEAAAQKWYEQEKAAQVRANAEAHATLAMITADILGSYKSRSFLVPIQQASHPRLLMLLNERVLHRIGQTYFHPDRPGEQHEIFTVDYGAYVRLRRTVRAVEENLFVSADTPEGVPFDDRRSIRRIVFDPNLVQVPT